MAYAKLKKNISTALDLFNNGEIDKGINFIRELVMVEEKNVRIPSAYNLFIKKYSQEEQEKGKSDKAEKQPRGQKIKEISLLWKMLPMEEKQVFYDERQELLDRKTDDMTILKSQITNKNLIRTVKKKTSSKIVESDAQHPKKAASIKTVLSKRLKEKRRSKSRSSKESIESLPNHDLDHMSVKTQESSTLDAVKNNEEKEKKREKEKKQNKTKKRSSPGEPVIIPKWNISSDNEDNDHFEHSDVESTVGEIYHFSDQDSS